MTPLSRTQSSSELFHGNEWPYSRPTTPLLHHTSQIGFIGLGTMGYIMARNLANSSSDHPLIVWNRSTSKSEKLASELHGRVVVAASVAELVEKCDVVFSSLANDEIVKLIYAEIEAHLESSPPLRTKIFVETSTNYPTTTGELDSLITKHKQAHFVAAPVFGAPPAAEKKQLLILLAGEPKMRKEVAYLVVPALGSKIIDMGGNVEKASKLKIIGNSMVLGQIELLAESLTLADKSGVGAANLYDVIKTIFPTAAFMGYGAKILNDQFDGTKGFTLEGGLKDASYVRKLAYASNSPVPTTDTAYQHLVTARAIQEAASSSAQPAPFEVLDWSALASSVRVQAGLPPFDSSAHGGVKLDN